MSGPIESPPTAPKRRPRRIFGIGAILLGVPILLWVGAGFFVARSLRYPDFLRRGGENAFGQHVPQCKRGEVVVIVPPAGAPETAMIPYVKFLLGAGYTVVAVYSANDPKYGINWG